MGESVVLNEAAVQLLSYGILGPVLVALAIAYWRKDKALQDCMACRTKEAIEGTRMAAEGTQAMRESTEALKANTEIIRDLASRR